MMNKDEALRLALEALEKVTKQMLAIRDEIAERGGRPTNNFVHEELWDSSFDVYLNCAIPTAEAIKTALEAKDESVALAWAEGYRMGIADERTSEANIGIAGFNAKVEPARENPYINTPPKRKPLTDEEIYLCTNRIDRNVRGWANEFARAIEAAHGIKENT